MATDFSGLGGSVSSIFGGVGSLMQAGAYDKAAALADENARITKLSTGIQLTQAQRQGYQVLGATEAATAANSLSLSGSAMDVFRSNAQQVSLQKQLTENQGLIEQHGWEEKAAADHGAAEAATASGIGSIVSGAIGLFSDERLKDILGTDGVVAPGINFYRFRFKGKPRVLRGVIAQEVQRVRPDAVMLHDSGYLMVNYGMLGLAGMTDA